MGPWDRDLFYGINGWSDALAPIFQFFSEGNKQWPVRIGLALLFVLFLWFPKTRTAAIVAMVSWPLANFVTDLLKAGFQMLRPCVELPDVHLRVDTMTSFGTASAHSANMAAVATAFTFYFGWRAWPWWVVAFMTGLSRIYVGVHYPSQVLFGWLTGIIVAGSIAYFVRRILTILKEKRSDKEPKDEGLSMES